MKIFGTNSKIQRYDSSNQKNYLNLATQVKENSELAKSQPFQLVTFQRAFQVPTYTELGSSMKLQNIFCMDRTKFCK